MPSHRHHVRKPGPLRPGMSVADARIAQALRDGQTVRLRAGKTGMPETVQEGDLLVVRAAQPEVGDVAVCWHRRAWIAHRVRQVEPGRLLLDGTDVEAWVPLSEVVGKVLTVRRDVRTWLVRLLRLVRFGRG
jgi:hypothetical protein